MLLSLSNRIRSSFNLIGDGLVWKVGNGVAVCLGIPSIMSFDLIVDTSHNHGFYFFNDIDN